MFVSVNINKVKIETQKQNKKEEEEETLMSTNACLHIYHRQICIRTEYHTKKV